MDLSQLDREKISSLKMRTDEIDELFRQFIFKVVKHPEEAVSSVDIFYALLERSCGMTKYLCQKALIEMIKALPEKKGEELIGYLCSHDKWDLLTDSADKILQKNSNLAKTVFSSLLLRVDSSNFKFYNEKLLDVIAKVDDQDSLWMWQQFQNKFPDKIVGVWELSKLYEKKTVLRPLLWEKIKSSQYKDERDLFWLMRDVAMVDSSKADEFLKFAMERMSDRQIYTDDRNFPFSIIRAVAEVDSSRADQCLELMKQRADALSILEADFFEVVGCVAKAAPHKAEECLNLISENLKKIKTSVDDTLDADGGLMKDDEYEYLATMHLKEAYRVLEIIRGIHPDKNKVDKVFEELMKNPSNSESLIKYAKIKMGALPLSSVKIAQKTKKDKNKNPFGFENVEAIDPDEPCVFCLGGTGSQYEKTSNGYMSSVQKLLKWCNLYKKVKLYSAVYDFDFFDKDCVGKDLIRKYRKKKDRTKIESDGNPPYFVQEIFDKAFLRRICDEKGQRLSLEEACKKMRKITVVAHCLGAGAFIKLEELIQYKMKELGYSARERQFIQHELLCIADAPMAPLGVSNSTMISFASCRDRKLYAAFGGSNFLEELAVSRFEDKATKKVKHLFSYFSKEKGELILIPSYAKDEDQHSFLSYNFMQRGLNFKGRFFVLMRANALVNGVKNSLSGEPLPSVKDLICGKNLIFRKMFEKFEQNGDTMWNKVVQNSTARLKNYRMLRIQR